MADYKQTLNLPKTDFEMRGGLAQKEPKMLESWDKRDLFNILYGTPPMYMFDRKRWAEQKERIVASYRAICPFVRRVGHDEMRSHEFLTEDHAVQRTTWSSGAEAVVNLGEKDHTLPDGRVVKAMGYLVR